MKRSIRTKAIDHVVRLTINLRIEILEGSGVELHFETEHRSWKYFVQFEIAKPFPTKF